jgi:hypothetical protein
MEGSLDIRRLGGGENNHPNRSLPCNYREHNCLLQRSLVGFSGDFVQHLLENFLAIGQLLEFSLD